MIQSVNAQVKNIYQNASLYLPSTDQLKTIAKTTALVALIIASVAIILNSAARILAHCIIMASYHKAAVLDDEFFEKMIEVYQSFPK